MKQCVIYVALSEYCKYDQEARDLLHKSGFKVRENRTGRRLRREETLELLNDADGVLAGLELYDSALLSALPRLRCISRCGVGTDNIDIEAARRHQITILTTEEEVVEPVAQMALAMILALARNFPLHCSEGHAGLWLKHTGYLLSEWTIGLVGFGRIGRAVGRYLQAFGPRLLVSDPNVEVNELPDGIRLCDLSVLLSESDLISLHAASRLEEGPLLDQNRIALMKPGSRLVNTARGHLVEEKALYRALKSGHLAGAALDVFETEPYVGPLARLPQVLCTPHVSTLTRASRVAMELRCTESVVKFFEQTRPASKLA